MIPLVEFIPFILIIGVAAWLGMFCIDTDKQASIPFQLAIIFLWPIVGLFYLIKTIILISQRESK